MTIPPTVASHSPPKPAASWAARTPARRPRGQLLRPEPADALPMPGRCGPKRRFTVGD
jgi:hypothetical protein